MRAKGGFNIYGQSIGILMLETLFPRILGDIGNALTFDFPVRYKIVKRASPKKVVVEGAKELLPLFIEGARELEAEGVGAVTTSCGFLAIFQREQADAVSVPIFTSSLLQIPLVYRMLRRDQKVGILIVFSEHLSREHSEAVGEGDIPVVIMGTERGVEFTSVFVGNELYLDVEKAKADVVEAAKTLISDHPEVGAIVLECTNMPPNSKAIQEAVGLPVFDIITLTKWVYMALSQVEYKGSVKNLI